MINLKSLAIVLAFTALSGCSDQKNAERVLYSAGYTDVKTTGYSMFSCGKDDTVSTGFVAKGPTGQTVEGAVCSGLVFKNSTIRIN